MKTEPFNHQRFIRLLMLTDIIGIIIFLLGTIAFTNIDSRIIFGLIGMILNTIGLYSCYIQYQQHKKKLYLYLLIINIVIIILMIALMTIFVTR